MVYVHWIGNVFKSLPSPVGEVEFHFTRYLLVYYGGNTYTSRFSCRFQSCRKIDTIAVNLATILQDFTDIQTDPDLNLILSGKFSVPGF